MVAFSAELGPSRTLRAAIDWIAEFSAAILQNPVRIDTEQEGAQLAHEVRDLMATSLHLFRELQAEHDAWANQLSAGKMDATNRRIFEKVAATFQKWHMSANELLKNAHGLARRGFPMAGLDEFEDCIGFCPYSGLSVEQWLAQLDAPDAPLVPLGEVRDGLRRRLHSQGR